MLLKWIAVVAVIAAGLAMAYSRGEVACANNNTKEVKQEATAVITKIGADAKYSAGAHNSAVSASNAAKEKIRAQTEVDRAAVSGVDDAGLRLGALELGHAVRRANGGM